MEEFTIGSMSEAGTFSCATKAWWPGNHQNSSGSISIELLRGQGPKSSKESPPFDIFYQSGELNRSRIIPLRPKRSA
jgi:hypothetical protein